MTLTDALQRADAYADDSLMGAYASLLWFEVPKRVKEGGVEDVVAALRWIGRHSHQGVDESYFKRDKLLPVVFRRGYELSDDPAVREALVDTIYKRIGRFLQAPIPAPEPNDSPELGRGLLRALIHRMRPEDRSIYELDRAGPGIVTGEDLEWLLAWHGAEPNADVKRHIRWVVRSVFNYTRLDHASAMLDACVDDVAINEEFQLIGSSRPADRPLWSARTRAQPPDTIEPSPPVDADQWIERHLAASVADPARWYNLLHALALEPEGTLMSSPLVRPVQELPGWLAKPERRPAILDAARRFLLHTDPNPETWLGKTEVSWSVYAGVQALHLLGAHAQQLAALPNAVLARWAIAMLGFGRLSDDGSVALAEALASRVPDAVAGAAAELVATPAPHRTVEDTVTVLPRLWCQPVTALIAAWLDAGELAPGADERLLEALVAGPDEARTLAHRVAWARLGGGLPPNDGQAHSENGVIVAERILAPEAEAKGSSRQRSRWVGAAEAAFALLEAPEFEGWWSTVSSRPDLLGDVLARLAHDYQYGGVPDGSPVGRLAASAVATLYRALRSTFPREEDPGFSGLRMRAITWRDHVAKMRDGLPRFLAARADEADLAALRELTTEFDDVRFYLDNARTQAARQDWHGWPLDELVRLMQTAANPTPDSMTTELPFLVLITVNKHEHRAVYDALLRTSSPPSPSGIFSEADRPIARGATPRSAPMAARVAPA